LTDVINQPQGGLIKLPYFDWIIKELDKGNADVEHTFGRHVHWGYWKDPKSADGTVRDFTNASERLCRMICDAAEIKSGMRVLDVGCGFGGTIASLNERFSPIELVGVNIDERQLRKARQKIKPIRRNSIKFIHANACGLPFEKNSFDVVLAVECIFHFPDRGLFFREAARVLKNGGRLSLSDVILSRKSPAHLSGIGRIVERLISSFYGQTSSTHTVEEYRTIAKHLGFKPLFELDITKGTLPTYPIVIRLLRDNVKNIVFPYVATRFIEWSHKIGYSQYEILAYEKY